MKVYFVFLISISLCCLTSCGEESSSEATGNNAPSQAAGKTASKPTTGLPALGKLRESKKVTKARIDVINGKNVRDSQGSISVEGAFLSIAGWAIDFPAKRNAAGVYIMVGNKSFPSTYGIKRSGLSDLLGDKKYVNSGFSAKIPVSKIGKGEHKVNIMVVSANRKAYFVNPQKEVIVKIQ